MYKNNEEAPDLRDYKSKISLKRDELLSIANYVHFKTDDFMEEIAIPELMLPAIAEYTTERFGWCGDVDGSFVYIANNMNINVDAEDLMLDFLTSDKCSYVNLALFLSFILEYLYCCLIYKDDTAPEDWGYDLTQEVGLDAEMRELMNIGDKCNIRSKQTREVVAVGYRVSSLDLIDGTKFSVEEYIYDEKIDAYKTLVIGNKIIADAVSKKFFEIYR